MVWIWYAFRQETHSSECGPPTFNSADVAKALSEVWQEEDKSGMFRQSPQLCAGTCVESRISQSVSQYTFSAIMSVTQGYKKFF